MKHVQRRHFFVRDMVENFEIEVPFVPTERNPADFFTKPYKSPAQFYAMRRIVMNEIGPSAHVDTDIDLSDRGGASRISSSDSLVSNVVTPRVRFACPQSGTWTGPP